MKHHHININKILKFGNAGKLFRVISVLFFLITLLGCKKFLTAPLPPNIVLVGNVFPADNAAINAVNGIYTYTIIGQNDSYITGNKTVSVLAGLSADEFKLVYLPLAPPDLLGSPLYSDYYGNRINGRYAQSELWTSMYKYIGLSHVVEEGLNQSPGVSLAVKTQLLGELEFIRALSYFYLLNLFGDVPITQGTDYKINSQLARAPVADVWKYLVGELKLAQQNLSNNFLDSSLINTTALTRVRPTRWAAKALLARAYLYQQDWPNAEAASAALIDSAKPFSLNLENLNNVFLINNKEAIWQYDRQVLVQDYQTGKTNINSRTYEADFFHITYGPGYSNPLVMSNIFLNSIDADDQRKQSWIGKYIATDLLTGAVIDSFFYSNKYKDFFQYGQVGNGTENLVVLRLAEQYLIRAEARAMQGNIAAAQDDLNKIRNRAGLPNTTASTKEDLMDAILKERRVELFAEFGHRWLDLKRLGRLDAVMAGPNGACAAKGTVWNSTAQLFPIPLDELKYDNKLVQNPGY